MTEQPALRDALAWNKSAALDAMNQRVLAYKNVASVALRNDKQFPEQLGIRVPTSKTAMRRAAPAKAKARREAKKRKN